jgi:hypothetical protein
MGVGSNSKAPTFLFLSILLLVAREPAQAKDSGTHFIFFLLCLRDADLIS